MTDHSSGNKVMRAIFSPAITLLNRINYTRKFTLLWLLSLLAVAVVAYSLFANIERIIQPSQRELEGFTLVKPISQFVQSLQLHRGISAALLGGNEAMRDRRAAEEKNAAEAFDAMERRFPPDLVSGEEFRNIKANWTLLRKEGITWAVAENFTAHTRLIEQLQMFEALAADKYGLPLDPELAMYYLFDTTVNKLPHALEHFGQLRAYGTGILAEKHLTENRQIELKIKMAELGSSLKDLNTSLEKTGRYSPAMQDSLRATYKDIVNSVQQITGIVTSDILTGHFSMPPEDFLSTATTAIDKSYAQIYDSLLPMAETLIKARIARARQEMFTSIGFSLLMFMLVVYLSVSIYYAIVGNIQMLVHSLRAFAGGDLHVRANLRTRDELRQIGESFNEMADGFSALLEARRCAEESLTRECQKNETLLRTASDGIHILDLEGNVMQVNDTFCKMLGYTAEELSTMNAAQWDTQWTAAQIKANITALGNDAAMLETRHRRRDGSIIDVEIGIVKVDVGGRQLIYCSAREVTGRKHMERMLAESAEKLRATIETALDAVVQMDTEGIIIGWNKQAEKIFGWTKEEAIGQALHETIIPPHYHDAHVKGMKHFLRTGEGPMLNSRVELLGLHRDGHEFPVELSITAINTAGKYEFNGFIHDITNRKKSEDLIWKQANFDTLTGLPNRRMFHDRLGQEIKKAHRAELKLALLFLDLDKFKEVNDTLGHSMGDILLVAAAHRIGGCVREADTVARLGGDEFTIILAELDDAGNVERVAESILQKLAEPFQLENEMAYISASIGITLYPDDATEVEELLKNADQAMYAAKNAGRNRFSYFTQSMQQAAQERLRLTQDLRGALADGQFRVYYQPIVNLDTGHINKAEALVRWQHPVRGIVNPAEFIPLAEETGLIIEIGDWVFKETAQQVKRWRTLYNPELQISVNESPVQFRSDSSLYGIWPAYLRELELPGQSMVIEITEGLLLDAESGVIDKLLKFHSVGIQISLDDFGTGYSSLSYLQKFDIDYLKIDQSFTRSIASDPGSMALSEAIIVMAHKLGMKVIAEGVETEQQCKLLAATGCDYGQGYLFSRPVPAEEFEALLRDNSLR